MKKCNIWSEKLSKCGFRLTKAREAIIEVLTTSNGHLSAEDIFMQIRNVHPEIGLTTVYRTLEILKNTNIVEKFDFGEGRARFELSEKYGNKAHHHHLICTGCQKIIDYFDFQAEEIKYVKHTEKAFQEKYNFKIERHLIRFYGICATCCIESTTTTGDGLLTAPGSLP